MKKLIFPLIMSFFALSANAQNVSFEETVIYIQSKVSSIQEMIFWNTFNSCVIIHVSNIEISQNGNISFILLYETDPIKFNIFDIQKIENGIIVYDASTNLCITLSETPSLRKYLAITFTTNAEAKRLEKAFKNLQVVCIKEVDPFDLPSKEDEIKTTRTETINDINKLLNSMGKLFYREPVCYGCEKKYEGWEKETTISYQENPFKYNSYTKEYTLSNHFVEDGWASINGDMKRHVLNIDRTYKSKLKGVIRFTEFANSIHETAGNCKVLYITVNDNVDEKIVLDLSKTDPDLIQKMKKYFEILNGLESFE